MNTRANANANPEKRLFISLITRDIRLVDAIIDLTDNSVNAAMKSIKNKFSTSNDFVSYLSKNNTHPTVTITVIVNNNYIEVIDDADGIDFESAKNDIFRFGHSEDYNGTKDRLSVYGIGMKRALFKIGNKITITSDHKKGGFSLDLNVQKWKLDETMPWTFPIVSRAPKSAKTGTRILIEELHEETQKRVEDLKFEFELIEKISKVYSYFLGRIIKISVNTKVVQGTDFEFGSNFSHDYFSSHGVDCTITAGIAASTGDKFLTDTSGWFVFCNYRTVIYGDKTSLTGWGSTLPIFQPKHRAFLGLITFTSADPEALPWTTTKGSVNEDNLIWQEAKARMVSVAKPVLHVLDSRYSSEGTDIQPSRVIELAGKNINVFNATVSEKKSFKTTHITVPKEVNVHYSAKKTDIEKVRKYYSRSSMSASEIGRKTFEFFLRNEIGDK